MATDRLELAGIKPEMARREGGIGHWVIAIYLFVHLMPLTLFYVHPSRFEIRVAILYGLFLMVLRGFCISAGYHRYFGHRSFKTSRVMQFLLAAGGCCALRGGPIWWAALHRHHHRFSDKPEDLRPPTKGYLWGYGGWMLTGRYVHTPYDLVKDLASYPELCWLNQNWLLPPFLLGLFSYLVGGWCFFALGFCFSTVLLLHIQALLDATDHSLGSRRFATPDTSRNSFWMALLTMGEGWHNNHHHYPSSANQGFFWGEVDGAFDILKVLARFGLVWGIRTPPAHILTRRLENVSLNNPPSSPVPSLSSQPYDKRELNSDIAQLEGGIHKKSIDSEKIAIEVEMDVEIIPEELEVIISPLDHQSTYAYGKPHPLPNPPMDRSRL